MQSLLHLYQLLAKSLARRACVCAYVHVVGWVENGTGILYAGADKYIHCDKCYQH